MDDPPALYSKLTPPSIRGLDAVEELVHVGLATSSQTGAMQAMLGEAVPTIENGLWVLLPEGRMELTWRIREGARWHDGAAFTTDDILFTAQVAQDADVPDLRDAALDAVEGIRAADARTLVITWKRPFIDADQLFTRIGATRARALPLPKHLLESAYGEDKATLTQAPYWGDEFVGTGPFRLKTWVQGSHIVLERNDAYVLGKPKLDEIEVRFFPDPNTLVANVLAGGLDITLGRGLALEQALLMRDQWSSGRLETNPSNWFMVWPQFQNPTPSVLADVRFRRAMASAIDRQELADSLSAGLSTVAHTYVSPTEDGFEQITAGVTKYPYAPRASSQALEELGFTLRPDGSLRDASDQRLSLEIRTTAGDTLRERMELAIADSWQRLGIAVEPVVVSRQLARDQEYRATFPSFELSRNPNTMSAVGALHSRAARLPENNFRGSGGTNYSRYTNPEFDALIDRYFVTIPRAERLEVARRIVGHIADQVVAIGMFYAVEPNMISNRLVNASGRSQGSTEAWNAHLWDLK
jgi:peptide/nickel transport system substrate-binding protein